jgi:hypothetical protein
MLTSFCPTRNDACNFWKFYSPVYEGTFYLATFYNKFNPDLRLPVEYHQPEELLVSIDEYFEMRKETDLPFHGFEVRSLSETSRLTLDAELIPQAISDYEISQIYNLNPYFLEKYVQFAHPHFTQKRPGNIVSFSLCNG